MPPENSGLLEGFFCLKFATNVTSLKLVDAKQVTCKYVSQYLVLQNCFGSLSGEQETQESCPTILLADTVEFTPIAIFLKKKIGL